MANFKQGYGDYSGVAGWSTDGANATNEIKSYPPNDFGLYDMAGNVAEWVADVYRPRVDMKMNDFNYYRGNVYTQNLIGEDGKVVIIGQNNVDYDTLSSGRIVAVGLPGEVKRVPIDEEQTYLRTNYSRSDNRDYYDGDETSSSIYGQTGDLVNQQIYGPGVDQADIDSIGLAPSNSASSKRTTLISNETRVVKGGSWKDYAYWLDPAQRRFYPQDMATDYIGFRNAMSRVGASSKKGRRAKD